MSRFYSIGVDRLRMATDGEGVTTLAAGHGCPLACRYCLNPQCLRQNGITDVFSSPEALYKKVKQDDLYFEATGGGITFGGGEPLLQADFIRDFILLCKKEGRNWHFNLETSLAVPNASLAMLDGLIDLYAADCKDMNAEIYRAYTGREPTERDENLRYLAKTCPDRVIVRVPLIPGYNTEDDRSRSADLLHAMGFSRLDLFSYRMPDKK